MAGLERTSCPSCGMLMVVVSGFGLVRKLQTQECLRCGHIERAEVLKVVFSSEFSDAQQARRFRDKATEAEQMTDLALTESRRETLLRIVAYYNSAADMFQKLANVTARN